MPFHLEYSSKSFDLTEKIQGYLDKKLNKLDRFLPDIENVHAMLSSMKSARRESDRYAVEITVRGKGYILRTEERASDITVAIDNSMDRLQRQIERLKGKRSKGRGDGLSAAEVAEKVAPKQEASQIVKRKQFIVAPMDEEEAIEQMKLLSHEDFFIFYNVQTESINIMYRRRDGAYGLIEPKLE